MKQKEKAKADHLERHIIIGAITSDLFISKVFVAFEPDLFTTSSFKTLLGWCCSFYKKYNKAPNKEIISIFDHHQRNGLDEDQAVGIQTILSSLSVEYQDNGLNIPYLIDRTDEFFKAKKLKALAADITAHLAAGQVEEADRLAHKMKTVDMAHRQGINPLTDRDAIAGAIQGAETDTLFSMPGKLGEFLGTFQRDTLVAVMAPEKRGKSFTMLEFVMRALLERKNVAFFEAGDMSEAQVIRRMALYLANDKAVSSAKSGRPVVFKTLKHQDKVKLPVLDCMANQLDECPVSDMRVENQPAVLRTLDGRVELIRDHVDAHIPCSACFDSQRYQKNFKPAGWKIDAKCEPLSSNEAIKKAERLAKSTNRSLKLITYPTGTLSVKMMEGVLDSWESSEGFVPDVIVIDYADLLLPDDKKVEYRHQINEIWKAMRGLAQKRHCVVITATQADAASYGKRTVGEANFSEDKRKYSHVSMVITLNQTPDDKAFGIMRYGKMFVREDGFDARQTISVLECKEIGRSYLLSF